jgi:hypothetical protein
LPNKPLKVGNVTLGFGGRKNQSTAELAGLTPWRQTWVIIVSVTGLSVGGIVSTLPPLCQLIFLGINLSLLGRNLSIFGVELVLDAVDDILLSVQFGLSRWRVFLVP